MSVNNEKKLVSIITPTYNDEKYIDYFLSSILNQTYENIEFIIVDDGSTDETKKHIDEFLPKFEEKGFVLKYIYQSHLGQASAINKALKVYSGNFIKWIDSDDMIECDCIEKQVNFLESNPEYGFCICDAKYVNYNSNGNFEFSHYFARKCNEDEDNYFMDVMHLNNNFSYGAGTILVRREALEKSIPLGEIYESSVGQNLQLMMPLTYYYKCGYIHEPLFIRVVIKNSHSHIQRTYEESLHREEEVRKMMRKTILRMKIKEEKEMLDLINIVIEKRILELANENNVYM